MLLSFAKMNGAGNDFVMVDNRDGAKSLDRETIARVCDRHRGIGADGLLAVEPAANGADFRMRYYNADGGEAEMCGNGARCFARFAGKLSGATDAVTFETQAGEIAAELLADGGVRLQMSRPKDLALGAVLNAAGVDLTVHFVNTGVPHAIVPVPSVADVDVQQLGAAIRYHTHFAPRGTNANFVQRLDDGGLAIRTYERGVEGETLACGTGVVAAALIFNQIYGLEGPIGVKVKGGDTLKVGFVRNGNEYDQVTLSGPADFVFEGAIEV